MTNWKTWGPPNCQINAEFAKIEKAGQFRYPDLRDDSPLVLATDYSGEHDEPDFQVLAFLLTPLSSVMTSWEPARVAVRKKYLADGRRMAFKKLSEPSRINALSFFLDAASELNGLLVCVAVDKGYSLSDTVSYPFRYNWQPAILEKLLAICRFGSGLVDGLRGNTQPLHWITDDDAIVVKDDAKQDAAGLMSGLVRKYPNEELEMQFGVASEIPDDSRIIEDLLSIPDLAAGACSETLSEIGKANIPTNGKGPIGIALFPQIKSSVINGWRSQRGKRLKHVDVVVRRADNGQTRFSFGLPFLRLPRMGESTEGAPTPNAHWRKAFETYLKAHGVDPVQTLKTMGIDPVSPMGNSE